LSYVAGQYKSRQRTGHPTQRGSLIAGTPGLCSSCPTFDVQVAPRFYIDKLGFEKRWHEADGKGKVCQVNRGECEIILCEDAARRDKGCLFVELPPDGLDELRREISERSVPTQKAWWGYDVIRIADADGNELLFPSE
jgi:hypothetical protein